jgi:uncharacterized membrane protein YeiH
MTATFITLLDFIGTFAFAISGALVAVRHRLDLFGVLVLSFAAATAGGIMRDVLLAGLGLFAVLGTSKALAAGLGPVGAVMIGVLTGVGGGVVRDMLVAQIPNVLRRQEIYAVTAMTAALVVVAGDALALPAAPVAVGGALLCFVLRLLAIRRGWKLPESGSGVDR